MRLRAAWAVFVLTALGTLIVDQMVRRRRGGSNKASLTDMMSIKMLDRQIVDQDA